ncbi:MAG: hypothetical protein OEM61_12780 [Desulfobacteraceae bacterium]|nr:hypothetical protein [Desulfobacteraceae bacterium]
MPLMKNGGAEAHHFDGIFFSGKWGCFIISEKSAVFGAKNGGIFNTHNLASYNRLKLAAIL